MVEEYVQGHRRFIILKGKPRKSYRKNKRESLIKMDVVEFLTGPSWMDEADWYKEDSLPEWTELKLQKAPYNMNFFLHKE